MFVLNIVIFVAPSCGERDIVVTISVWCMCVRRACMHQYGLVRAITCTFMHGFQNNLAQLLPSRSRSDV